MKRRGSLTKTCPNCGGMGAVRHLRCQTCRGAGRVRRRKRPMKRKPHVWVVEWWEGKWKVQRSCLKRGEARESAKGFRLQFPGNRFRLAKYVRVKP